MHPRNSETRRIMRTLAMHMRALLLTVALLLPVTATAQESTRLKLPTTVYLVAITADKATTLNCTLRPGCWEDNPMYRWADKSGGPLLQMTVSTGVDLVSIWAWNKTVGRKHPKLAALGLYSMAAIRATVAARNYARVRRSY